MADQEKWELSREEINERLRKLKQKKAEPTRGGRSSGQGVKLLYIRDYLYHHATKEHLWRFSAALSRTQERATQHQRIGEGMRHQQNHSLQIKALLET